MLRAATCRDEGTIYKIIDVGGSILGDVPTNFAWDHIDQLIEHRLVYGRGTPTKVRRFYLDAELAEVERFLGFEAGRIRRERAASPIELMRRYCADRKTTRKRRETIINGRRVFHVEWFEHKANAGLRYTKEK